MDRVGMAGEATKILLVGNAPHRNRGCEAIVRGTMEILSATYGGDLDVPLGVSGSPETVAAQKKRETDPRVKAFSVSKVGRRGSPKWLMSQANARLGTNFQHHVGDLQGHAEGARAALEVGGDNYSLDYGGPGTYIAMDRWLKARGVPVVIWGASVGPFEGDPAGAKVIFDHLKTLDGIFVREPLTKRYLAQNGVEDNVHQVADPAFLMSPEAPEDEAVRALAKDGAIGINLSPLVARFGGGAGLEAWRDKAVELVVAAAQLGRPILLVPHVGAPNKADDDFAFMTSVHRQVAQEAGVPVDLVPDGLNAMESKWLISRLSAFAGARTHATIAAFSTAVPTLSLSYSVKAQGINEDLFGHTEFCQSVKTLTPDVFAAGLSRLLAEEDAIRTHLSAEIPRAKERAMAAGGMLKDIVRDARTVSR